MNNVAIRPGAAVQVTRITFRNTRVGNAVVAVPREQFGRGHVHGVPVAASALAGLTPAAGAPPVKPAPASLATGPASTLKPTGEVLARPSVTLHVPRENSRLPWRTRAPKAETPKSGTAEAPGLRFVPPRRKPEVTPAPFGMQAGPERSTPTPAPRFDEMRRPAVPPKEESRAHSVPQRAEPAPVPAAPSATPTPAAEPRERIIPKKVEPPRPTHPETTPSSEARERAAARKPETLAAPPRPAAAMPTVPPQRETPRRETRREEAGTPARHAGQTAEAAPKERGHDGDRGLPGRPANRMSPKHQGMDGAQK